MIPSPFQALRISHRDVRGTRVTGDEVQWTMEMRKKRDVWVRGVLFQESFIPHGTPGEFYCLVSFLVSVYTGNGEGAIVGFM